jgi:hypothetical protein
VAPPDAGAAPLRQPFVDLVEADAKFLAVDGDAVFWVDGHEWQRVRRVDRHGGDVVDLAVIRNASVTGLAATADGVYWTTREGLFHVPRAGGDVTRFAAKDPRRLVADGGRLLWFEGAVHEGRGRHQLRELRDGAPVSVAALPEDPPSTDPDVIEYWTPTEGYGLVSDGVTALVTRADGEIDRIDLASGTVTIDPEQRFAPWLARVGDDVYGLAHSGRDGTELVAIPLAGGSIGETPIHVIGHDTLVATPEGPMWLDADVELVDHGHGMEHCGSCIVTEEPVAGTGRIMRLVDGVPEVWISGLQRPWLLAADAAGVVWFDRDERTIRGAPLP